MRVCGLKVKCAVTTRKGGAEKENIDKKERRDGGAGAGEGKEKRS